MADRKDDQLSIGTKTSFQETETGTEFSGETQPSKIIDLLSKKIDSLENRQKDLDAKLERSQSTNIEILGLFVALFTFVSIEFQLVRTFDYFEFLGISLLFAGLLLLFVLILHTMISKDLSLKIILFSLFCILLILLCSRQFINLRDISNSKKVNTERSGYQSSQPLK